MISSRFSALMYPASAKTTFSSLWSNVCFSSSAASTATGRSSFVHRCPECAHQCHSEITFLRTAKRSNGTEMVTRPRVIPAG